MRSLLGRAASSAAVPAARAGRAEGAGRRVAAAALVLSASALTACAAGQHAQTSEERPTIDGWYGSIGSLQLSGVSLAAPTGNTWPYGASVPLTLYVANTGRRPDRLVDVSSKQFSGWRVVRASSNSGSSGAASPTSASASAPPSTLDTGSPSPQTVPSHGALSLGLAAGYGATGTGSGKVLELTGLKAQLYPAASVMVTLKFQHAGSVRIPVPVQITSTAASESVSGTNTSGAAGING